MHPGSACSVEGEAEPLPMRDLLRNGAEQRGLTALKSGSDGFEAAFDVSDFREQGGGGVADDQGAKQFALADEQLIVVD